MPPPFVIFALPRSRTAWLSKWLSCVSGAPVGHDLAIEADSIDGWLEMVFRRYRGTCETGAVEAWPILRRSIPDCRIIVVQRLLPAVTASLEAAGYAPPLDDLRRRAGALEALAAQDGVLSVDYEMLADPFWCAAIQEYALAMPFDWHAWLAARQVNVQVNAECRLARLIERQPHTQRLKAELVERLACPRPFVTVGEEAWAGVADDCERMGATHHAEATEGLEGAFHLNRDVMLQMAAAGLWRVFVARVDSELAGYCCWTHSTNLEADAPKTMMHGPFYAAPQFANHKLGLRLLRVSREVLAADGYRVLMLHHTTRGRGARAGRLYEAMGAIEYQREYIWRIGADG